MKKAIGLIALLILIMGLVGCNGETVNIDFPFEVGDVENIEMYHYAGVPVSADLLLPDITRLSCRPIMAA